MLCTQIIAVCPGIQTKHTKVGYCVGKILNVERNHWVLNNSGVVATSNSSDTFHTVVLENKLIM